MSNQTPLTLEELKKSIKPIKNANVEHQQSLSKLERVAVWITDHIGTVEFAIGCVILVSIPLIWQSTMPVVLYISSGYLQLVFLPLIMVGQNLQDRHAEARAQADYEVNIQSAQVIETILLRLENQEKMIVKLSEQLGQR